ncbi:MULTISPECIES: N-acetyl-alpha-D-glucosaminyl L-malate synthase BshA [Croceitalea]|uniref:N-acetyl-alpha-D-glucosaminyl L-malate synthase BshA n=1 Tax=Croceitalea vernalis TaxID=3075599 RepID=A0ABU3BKG8_9FLAO|nr:MULTISPECIES: N-acetyl-alpha-D-glucosaminyl L-malate synthase BshA [unclassified Croceitalea]MDT0540965.1 N-acetyl-alpha-D-glucosaminyl L-malate synthase BshA [Croceitalea sp. P059]MDT0622653.1 N-acetyl-alpha-D-glucosaminyl L-malate synthase BshA [Croceitalea sp. P007]
MKIAIVCYPTFGGSGVVATELGIALAERGHEVHFVTYRQPVRLELLNNNIHFHEVHVPDYPLFRYQPYELALSSKLVDTIKLYGIELLHVHYAIPHAYAGYMAKKMLKEDGIYIPMITTLHGTDITLVGNHPFYKSAVTFSINKSDVVTSVSEDLKQKTLNIFDVEQEINVIPNFIDRKKYSAGYTDCQRTLMANEDEKIITHISNFRKVKRIPDVINVFNKVLKEVPSKLIMVGEGPEKENAEKLCEELGISDNVLFLGNSNEIDRILCFSDLFLLPSETESFGLAALEAMINKVAIISSNTGGIPEVNKHGETGFLSDVGAVDDMAQNAVYLLSDDKILEKFKDKAQKTASEFDILNILPLYEDVYERAYKSRFKNSY